LNPNRRFFLPLRRMQVGIFFWEQNK